MWKFTRGLTLALAWFVGCACLDLKLFKLDESESFNDTSALIDESAKILCTFDATTVYVYFENNTSMGVPGFMLSKLNHCGTSVISLRNKYKTAPLEKVQDDGVQMYLVIMIKDASQRIDLSMVKKKSASKHRSFFYVIVENSTDIDNLWLHSAFERFWDIWVLNAVIVFWRDGEMKIYTYSPFSNRFLRPLSPNVSSRDDLFPRKMLDMNGRALRICLYPDNVRALFLSRDKILGADGFMSSFVANRLNATRVVRLPFNYRINPSNSSGDLCLREMISEKSAMALNTRFLSMENFEDHVEHSVVYGRDDLCVLVPKSKPASLFWNLFRSFQIPVWVAIVLMLLVTYAFCRILLPHVDQLLTKLYSTMLTQPLNETPARISVRLFLIFWFSYCLLISGAYKCNLTSNLVFRVSLPEIDTFSDLAESEYGILVYARHQKFVDKFLDSAVPHLKMIKRKTIPVAEDFLITKLDENDVSYAYLQKFHDAYFRVNSRKNTQHGRPLYHLMSICPIPFQSVYIVPYGSPYLGFLNTLVRRIHEHGFVEYWTKYMDTQFKHSGKYVVRNSQNDDDPVVLRFAHLQAAFCILGLGFLLATGVLIWEIYRVYGIGTFIYNRQRWNEEHLQAIQNEILRD